VAELLRSVSGVKAVVSKGADGAANVFEVEAEGGRDLREELAKAVVGKGFGLVGLAQIGMSLEEIFLHLTTSEPQAANKPEVTQ
jgi:ABC-2 type transport system ATP-binding protein